MLLGVKAVIAESFERIHRSNLVNMGVLPLEFVDGATAASLSSPGTKCSIWPAPATRLTPRSHRHGRGAAG